MDCLISVSANTVQLCIIIGSKVKASLQYHKNNKRNINCSNSDLELRSVRDGGITSTVVL